MTPRFVDSHCHLHFPPYDNNREAVISRMRIEKVWAITVGTSGHTSRSAIRLADATEGVWASVGHHPEHLTSSFRDPSEGEVGEFGFEELRRIATSSKKVVAIGETGLDFFRIDEGRDREEAMRIQENAFRDHIALAEQLDLPIIIHCRDALKRLAEIVQEEKSSGRRVRGVVHCFTGTWEEAQPLLDLDLHLSFTGIITFPPKKNDDPERHVQRVIERMPLDRMLIETDAPWLAPVPHRGKQNEPAFVHLVAERVATLRKTDIEDIAKQTTRNSLTLFSLH